MIAIVNVGKARSKYPDMRKYEIRIGGAVKAVFKHRRSAGLAACLRSAAVAVECQESEDMVKLLAVPSPDPTESH